jgi:malonate transporter
MHEIVLIVAPVAALVLLGWAAGRFRYLPETAATALPAFAFKVTMPALIFRAFISVDELPAAPGAMIFAYFGAVAVVWIVATLAVIYVLRRPAPDAAPIAMASGFSNTVMLGLPLSFAAFGEAATIPAAIIIAIDTPLMWLVAVLHIETALQRERGFDFSALTPIFRRLATNPIILATLAGVAGRFAGLELGPLPGRLVDLLADAAVPTALFALGLSLSTFRLSGQAPTLAAMTVLKLALLPAAVYVLAVYVFPMPPVWFAVAMLFAALPVGANPYLFAAQYRWADGTVSAAIAVTTLISLVTVSAMLYYLKQWPGM